MRAMDAWIGLLTHLWGGGPRRWRGLGGGREGEGMVSVGAWGTQMREPGFCWLHSQCAHTRA